MQWKAHPGTSWAIWIYLTAKWTKPSLSTAPSALSDSQIESCFHLSKNKGGKVFARKQFSLDACHGVVSTPESRHTCGPLWEMCPPPQSAESTTRQRLKHAEVIQHRRTETLRRAVPNTGAVLDTAFIYSEKFSALYDLPLPTYPRVKHNLHPTLDGSLQSNKSFQYRKTFLSFGPMRNISWKLEYYLLPDKALYFLCAYVINQGKKKVPQRNGRGKKSSYQNVNICA